MSVAAAKIARHGRTLAISYAKDALRDAAHTLRGSRSTERWLAAEKALYSRARELVAIERFKAVSR